MIGLILLDLILNYCRSNYSVNFCADKINECIDRRVWEYRDISPQVYPDELLMISFFEECADEVKIRK